MKIALAGARHAHARDLIKLAKNTAGVSFSGAWEEDAQARAAYAEKGINFSYSSYEELLSDGEVGIVMICDYYGRRGKLAIDALRAGKHVLADKPLCTSIDELEEISRLAKKNNLSVGCLLTTRYSAASACVKKLLGSGELGEVRSVSFTGQHPLMCGTRPGWYFEDGKHGGTITDIAIHGVDLLRYLTGSGVREVSGARVWNAYAKEAPDFRDSAQFILTLENGAGVTADVSYSSPDSFGYKMPTLWRFWLWCEGGMIDFGAEGRTVTVYKNGLSEPYTIIGETPEATCLSDLLDEASGRKPKILTTHDVISSSRDVLTIQRHADKSL